MNQQEGEHVILEWNGYKNFSNSYIIATCLETGRPLHPVTEEDGELHDLVAQLQDHLVSFELKCFLINEKLKIFFCNFYFLNDTQYAKLNTPPFVLRLIKAGIRMGISIADFDHWK